MVHCSYATGNIFLFIIIFFNVLNHVCSHFPCKKHEFVGVVKMINSLNINGEPILNGNLKLESGVVSMDNICHIFNEKKQEITRYQSGTSLPTILNVYKGVMVCRIPFVIGLSK